MSAIVPAAKQTEECTIVGPEELLIRAVRTPETTKEREQAINDALKVYVESRQKLQSDRSGAQWNLVNEHMNTVQKTLKYVGAMTVVQGNALWELPSDRPTPKPDLPNDGSDAPAPDGEKKKKAQATPPIPKTRTTVKKEQPNSKSSALGASGTQNNATSKSRKKRAPNDDDQWKKFQDCLPPPDTPSVQWLTNVRDIVAEMGDACQSKAHATVDAALWCQLVFLNVHRGHSRTLNKTKVCKIDISDWDLVPAEADEPCKTCGTKIACQWPNNDDRSKCRECHLQAKRCVPGEGNITKTSHKRKRASASPVPRTTRRRLVSDEDEGEEEDEKDEEEPTSPRNPLPKPTKPAKPSTSTKTPANPSTSKNPVRPRPTLKTLKPSVVIPRTDVDAWPTATTSSTSAASIVPQGPSAYFANSLASSPQTKPPSVPSLQLLMDQSLKTAENMPEGSPFDGEPDADEVNRILAGLADLDRDGYKVELAKTIISLNRVLKRNELIIEGLKTFASKETAVLAALKKREKDSHRAIMDMLNTLF